MASVLGFSVVGWGSSSIGTYLIPGTSVKLTMRKEVAPLLVAFCRDFHREVEPLVKGWCWGFNPKRIEGSSTWSNHAWGGAVDLNAPRHPMGKRNTFSAADQAAINRLLGRYTHKGTRLIRWGGTYRRADDMHFEINVPRAVALAAVAAMKPVAAGQRVLRRGSTGEDVKVLQKKLDLAADGKFGPATETKVTSWQKDHGLTADGIVGPATWKALGVK